MPLCFCLLNNRLEALAVKWLFYCCNIFLVVSWLFRPQTIWWVLNFTFEDLIPFGLLFMKDLTVQMPRGTQKLGSIFSMMRFGNPIQPRELWVSAYLLYFICSWFWILQYLSPPLFPWWSVFRVKGNLVSACEVISAFYWMNLVHFHLEAVIM